MSAADRWEFVETLSCKLGPASLAWLQRPEVKEKVERAVQGKDDLEDSVLREVYEGIKHESALGDEFIAYLMSELLGMSHGLLASEARPMLASEDLLQSTMREFWEGRDKVQFWTRGQFLALIYKRIKRKAIDEGFRARAKFRTPRNPDSTELPPPVSQPGALASRAEESAKLAILIPLLSERDQIAVKLYLDGGGRNEVAEVLGISPDAASAVLSRAKRKLAEMISRSHD